MKSKQIRFVVEIAILCALAIVFDFLCGEFLKFSWVQGGSINIAMVPIFIVGYKYGLKGGLLAGLLVGIIQIIYTRVGLAHPFQVMLDYVFAYTVGGLFGLSSHVIRKSTAVRQVLWIIISIFIVFIIKGLLHTISGMIYFSTDLVGSLIYNLPFCLLSAVVCCIITPILIKSVGRYFLDSESEG